jgi:hypothetical protein
MRTKTLIVAAALGAVGTATAMAQVYSVNAVGYVNLDVAPGFTMICNPLDAGTGNNTVGQLLSGVPIGTAVYKFDSAAGTYVVNTFLGAWTDAAMTMAPGEGVFIKNNGTASFTITFVGEVRQGTLDTAVPAGFAQVSSQVPQAGGVTTVLEFPAAVGDAVYTFDPATQQYGAFTYLGVWSPSEPSIGVGEAFFSRSGAAKTWSRTFSVNQ